MTWEESAIQNAALMVANTLDFIADECGITDLDLFLSGDNNFRKKIYPEYKSTRKKNERPPVLVPLKELWKENFTVFQEDELEADDLLGKAQDITTCIVSIDKDMLMIPGYHYNYVRNELYFVSDFNGIYNFYYQLLIGDPTDDIKGAKGIGKAKAVKILQDCETEEEMFNAVYPYFTCYEELDMNARLVWIQRKGRENWNDTGIGESERQDSTEACEGPDPEDIPWS